MELARHPSDKNIENWFAYIELKNKLMSNLQDKLHEYMTRKGAKATPAEKGLLTRHIANLSEETTDARRYRFRLYFESSCPHCQRMLTTMEKLRSAGYFVEIHQIDQRKPDYPVPFPLIPASKQDLVDRKINSWPTLFVADTTQKMTYRINGYLPKDQVLKVLESK